MLAIKDANERNGSVIQEFATLPQSMLPISTLAYDSMSTERGGLHAFHNASLEGVQAVVGPARSAVCEPVSTLANIFRVPVVSFWSSSPTLSNQEVHPFFSRSHPSDATTGVNLIRFVWEMGWKHVSVLYVEDDYGFALRDTLVLGAMSHDVRVEKMVSFLYADSRSITSAVSMLVGGPNIIIFIGFDADLEPMVRAAWDAELLTPEYAWLLTNSLSTDAVAGAEDPEWLTERVEGFSMFQVETLDSPGAERMHSHWMSQDMAACANELFDVPTWMFEAPPPELARYHYDAAAMVVLALATGASGGDALNDAVRSTSFSGATGRVRLTPGTGDRDPNDLGAVLLNWQRDSSGNLVVVPTARMGLDPNSTTQWLADSVWIGGRASPPVDRIARAELEASQRNEAMKKIILSTFILLGIVGPCVLSYVIYVAMRRVRQTRQVLQDYQESLKKKLDEALSSTHEMQFPVALIKMQDFIALGSLEPHETLRQRGLLHYHDRLSDVLCSSDRIVFFSHQWTSFTEPDPTNVQYETMVATLKELVKRRCWFSEMTYVWCDYVSIPQRSRNTQKLAIASLSMYASLAHAFVIVAPSVRHQDTGRECDVDTYNRRMWCRAENLCHSLRNGIHEMWLATGTDADQLSHLDENPQVQEMMRGNLRVMHGDVTCPEDKVELVLPILGLYALVFARHLRLERLGSSEDDLQENSQQFEDWAGPSPRIRKRLQEGKDSRCPVFDMIQQSKDEIFPERVDIQHGADYALMQQAQEKAKARRRAVTAVIGKASRALHTDRARSALDNSISALDNSVSLISRRNRRRSQGESLELFGPLIGMMEDLIENDEDLCGQLAKQEEERRAAYMAVVTRRKYSEKTRKNFQGVLTRGRSLRRLSDGALETKSIEAVRVFTEEKSKKSGRRLTLRKSRLKSLENAAHSVEHAVEHAAHGTEHAVPHEITVVNQAVEQMDDVTDLNEAAPSAVRSAEHMMHVSSVRTVVAPCTWDGSAKLELSLASGNTLHVNVPSWLRSGERLALKIEASAVVTTLEDEVMEVAATAPSASRAESSPRAMAMWEAAQGASTRPSSIATVSTAREVADSAREQL